MTVQGQRDTVLVWRTSLIVFLANCAILVLQLVAGRLLSPFIGVSLATWTAIIGVFLAGISLGNWLGGKVADRSASGRSLAILCLLGAIATLAMLLIVALLGDGTAVRSLPLLARISLLTTIVCLPASLILSMLTPLAIKVMLPDVRRAGSVVGLVYALGTLGSLAGNFLTGFVLVALLPINQIVIAVAVILLGLALLAFIGGPSPGRGEPERSEELTLVFEPDAPATTADGATSLAVRPAAPVAAVSPLALPGNVALACVVVFIASFCSLTVELAASRILAPYVGVSLFSWTGIIGVVLAGIALGNFLGGKLADRWPSLNVLGVCLFLAGMASLAVLALLPWVTTPGRFTGIGLLERIVVLAACLFFVPVLFLGTISPQVIRLVITRMADAGRVAGRVYAWSTAGAIVGTFAVGWLLIGLLGVNMLMLVASLGLILLAVLVGQFWRRPVPLIVMALMSVGAVGGLMQNNLVKANCTSETNYFCIRVYDDIRTGVAVRVLVLDHLVHSFVKLGDPSYLGYEHEQVQAEMTRYLSDQAAQPRVLVIGGGGYTYPRWVDAFVPKAVVDVVEIDPGVTEINYAELGLDRQTRINSHNLDGRQFVHELAQKGSYQLVVQDAVNDLSVPYHIMTKEYNDDVEELLTPDGVYLLTVIDLYKDGQLLRAAIRTMMQTFPEVHLLSTYPAWNSDGASVFVIYGSNRKLNLDEMRQVLARQGAQLRTIVQPDDLLNTYVAAGPQIVLTDQYAPVDNLISILFSRRYG